MVIQAADPPIMAFYIHYSLHFICDEVKGHNFKSWIRGASINSKISVMSGYTYSLLAVSFVDVLSILFTLTSSIYIR